jgi:two-component system response regulator HydG
MRSRTAPSCALASETSLVDGFAQARRGTLFLDDIGELALAAQPHLLQALQDPSTDVRIIAAASADLQEKVEDKRFREDLYYRINVIHVPLPPLRARGGDVLLLADQLVKKYAAVIGKNVTGIAQPAAQRMLAYEWPGNVRELTNCIERAVATTKFEQLQVDDLPDSVRTRSHKGPTLSGHDLPELLPLEEVERRRVLRVLEACNGNRTDAAKMLGLDRKTLYRKLLRWGVGDD